MRSAPAQIASLAFAMRVSGAFFWAVAGGLGCAPSHHTPPPYNTDAAAAARLEARAQALCESRPESHRLVPVRPFITDGCSAWPDGERYVECCVEHDLLYWCGGGADERLAADDAFGQCVSDRTSGLLGGWMRMGVRIGGHPVFPTHYRWGYGLDYLGGYPERTALAAGDE